MYNFRLQWNGILHWKTRKYEFPSPLERNNRHSESIAICSDSQAALKALSSPRSFRPWL